MSMEKIKQRKEPAKESLTTERHRCDATCLHQSNVEITDPEKLSKIKIRVSGSANAIPQR